MQTRTLTFKLILKQRLRDIKKADTCVPCVGNERCLIGLCVKLRIMN